MNEENSTEVQVTETQTTETQVTEVKNKSKKCKIVLIIIIVILVLMNGFMGAGYYYLNIYNNDYESNNDVDEEEVEDDEEKLEKTNVNENSTKENNNEENTVTEADNANVKFDVTSTLYEKKVNLNGKTSYLKLVVHISGEDDWGEYVYTLKLDDKEVWNSVVEATYSEEDYDSEDEDEYIKDLKILKGTDNKEYLVVNLDLYGESNVIHDFVVMSDSGKKIIDYDQGIYSHFYKLKGPNDKRYMVSQNECHTYFSDWACSPEYSLYSFYKIDSNKIYMLSCKDGDEKITEYEVEVSNDSASVKATGDKYIISNNDDLSGGGWECPSYRTK